MFGAQYVVHELSEQQVRELQPWTEGQINSMVRAALGDPRCEDARVLREMHDAMMKPCFRTVARSLGEDPDTSGGTIGEPRTPAMWMKILREIFEDHCLVQNKIKKTMRK